MTLGAKWLEAKSKRPSRSASPASTHQTLERVAPVSPARLKESGGSEAGNAPPQPGGTAGLAPASRTPSSSRSAAGVVVSVTPLASRSYSGKAATDVPGPGKSATPAHTIHQRMKFMITSPALRAQE